MVIPAARLRRQDRSKGPRSSSPTLASRSIATPWQCGVTALPRHSTVIPTEVSRRFFFSFAPAKESAYAVEESLFDLSDHSSVLSNLQLLTSNLQNLHSH